MKLKVGDEVSFLNEKGSGVVCKLINSTTVNVRMDDGFELPCLESELILMGGEQPPIKREAISSEVKMPKVAKPASYYKKTEPEGLYIAFSPENENDISDSNFNLWFINATNYEVFFTCSELKKGEYTTSVSERVPNAEHLLIATYSSYDLQMPLNLKIDALYFNEDSHKGQAPVSELIKFKPKKLYADNVFKANGLLSVSALLIPISNIGNEHLFDGNGNKADLSALLFQKNTKVTSTKKSIPHIKNSSLREMEVDLHIEELVDNHKGMSNFEIMTIQLRHLQEKVDQAISQHYRSVVVIHGVGTGKLRDEVHKVLATYKKLKFHDASYAKYGFGATEVELF